jgi:hypothetical protein
MNSDDEPSSPWRPEAAESVLREMADSMNRVFGRDFCARVEENELVVQIGGRVARIAADGQLLGASSIPPFRE